jgi:hypothetical protein
MVFDGFAPVLGVAADGGGGAVGPSMDWPRDPVCVEHAARDTARQRQMAVCATPPLIRQLLSLTVYPPSDSDPIRPCETATVRDVRWEMTMFHLRGPLRGVASHGSRTIMAPALDGLDRPPME